jgi:hypothetical protein
MTPRPHAWTRRAALVTTLLAGASLLSLPGCGEFLYFLQPYDPVDPAPGPKLKGKKIVVLTHLSSGAGSEYGDLARDLSREITTIVRKEVKKVTVVDPDKIGEWVKAHPSWTDPAEAAKAFEADMVILFDVAKFETEDYKSPELMEGKSSINIQVWEIAHPKNSKGQEITSQPKESSKIYEETADSTFPSRGPVAKGGVVSPSAFRIKFLKIVALELSWHFVDKAPGDDIQDMKFNPDDH